MSQVSISTNKIVPLSNGLIEGKIFQSVHGILGHHDLHGPKGWNRSAGLGNYLAELTTLFLGNRIHRRDAHHTSSVMPKKNIKKNQPEAPNQLFV